MMDVLHAPKNTFKIEEIYAYISVDDGNEGICAFTRNNTMIPMIGADLVRMRQLKPIARDLAKISPYPIKLIKLSTREEVEEVKV